MADPSRAFRDRANRMALDRLPALIERARRHPDAREAAGIVIALCPGPRFDAPGGVLYSLRPSRGGPTAGTRGNMKAPSKTRLVVSVLVADRVGILRDVTAALTDLGANIDGISQTVVEGYFTVILTATFDAPTDAEPIQEAIQRNFHGHEASVVVRAFDPRAVRQPPVQGDRYVVTLRGEDRKGILKATMAYFAEKGINVEDWYVHFDGPRVTHVGEVTVPEILDIQQVQREFQQHLQEYGMRVSVQHENIFRVTNEVGAVRPLLKA